MCTSDTISIVMYIAYWTALCSTQSQVLLLSSSVQPCCSCSADSAWHLHWGSAGGMGCRDELRPDRHLASPPFGRDRASLRFTWLSVFCCTSVTLCTAWDRHLCLRARSCPSQASATGVSTCGVRKSLHPAQTHTHVRGTCCPTESAFSPQLGGRQGGSRWGDQHWLALTLSALRFGEEVLTAQPQCIWGWCPLRQVPSVAGAATPCHSSGSRLLLWPCHGRERSATAYRGK